MYALTRLIPSMMINSNNVLIKQIDNFTNPLDIANGEDAIFITNDKLSFPADSSKYQLGQYIVGSVIGITPVYDETSFLGFITDNILDNIDANPSVSLACVQSLFAINKVLSLNTTIEVKHANVMNDKETGVIPYAI